MRTKEWNWNAPQRLQTNHQGDFENDINNDDCDNDDDVGDDKSETEVHHITLASLR